MKKTLKSLALLFFGPFLLAGLAGCGGEEPAPIRAPETVSGLAVLTVQPQPMPDTLEAVGTVRAAQTSQLSAQLMGTITDIRVSEGSRVRRGEVLIVLDDAQPRAGLDRARAALSATEKEIAAAEADLNLTTATLRRYQDLYQKKSVSSQEFDEVEARQRAAEARHQMAAAGREQARASLAQSESQFGYSRIRAPFDGVVTEKLVDVGTLAAPGLPLLVVEDTARFRLEASVDESDIRYVAPGQSVPVVIDSLGDEVLTGPVAQVVPAADVASRSFLVKVELPVNAALRSGLFGRALFTRGERRGLRLPATAVVQRGQLDAVYVLDAENIARLRYITLGKRAADQVEVLSGLEAGERVVGNPGQQELAGKRVEGRQP